MWHSISAIIILLCLGLSSTFPSQSDSFSLDTKDVNSNDFHNDLTRSDGPYFGYASLKNITILSGNTAHLRCQVKNIGNRTVSWVRHRDINLLTVGIISYTNDKRYQSIHNVDSDEWTLRLRYAHINDTGFYECQISTTPPQGQPVYLSVVEPITTILGEDLGEIFINQGSTINLTCIVRNLPETSSTVMHWTHNNEEINYDSQRGGVSVITEKGDMTTSYLLIQRAKPSDSGKYKCSPSNANPKSLQVHILKGEYPEAMHAIANTNWRTANVFYVFCLILLSQMITER